MSDTLSPCVRTCICSYPLAQIITAPFCSALCHRQGRLNTALIGLALVAAGALLFGVGGSIAWHMAARYVCR